MRSFFLLLIALLALTYWYLYPGSEALFKLRTDTVMSDGTDATPLPYSYDLIRQAWKEYPLRFLYGAVYLEGTDPEHGVALWLPWNERWLALLVAEIVPLEQVSTAFVFLLFLFNGLAMYLLGRYLGWARLLSFALAIAWAFNCYTRARAKVHGALVGTYHLPLIFLGLYLVARGRSKRSLIGAMIAFLLAGSAAHYYLVTCVFLSPLFILFLVLQKEFFLNWRRIAIRFLLAALPLIAFLGFNFTHPVPSEARVNKEESMALPTQQPGQPHPYLPYLQLYHAHPIDFLGGDLNLESGGKELNPLRAIINQEIIKTLGLGNTHERSNGIRWSILMITVWALVTWARGKWKPTPELRRNLFFFIGFALFTFWLSLSPDIPFANGGASYLLFSVFPKVRVASRAGIHVHFALLMIIGFFISQQANYKNWRWPLGLIFIFILDYPPAQRMPMAPVYPAYNELNREKGPCGIGMTFPFTTSNAEPLIDFIFSQRMRGSDCLWLNRMSNPARAQWMLDRFPPTREFLNQLPTHTIATINLEKVARCVPLNWIAFHELTPLGWAQAICFNLGWKFYPDMTCIAPERNSPLKKYPDEC